MSDGIAAQDRPRNPAETLHLCSETMDCRMVVPRTTTIAYVSIKTKQQTVLRRRGANTDEYNERVQVTPHDETPQTDRRTSQPASLDHKASTDLTRRRARGAPFYTTQTLEGGRHSTDVAHGPHRARARVRARKRERERHTEHTKQRQRSAQSEQSRAPYRQRSAQRSATRRRRHNRRARR